MKTLLTGLCAFALVIPAAVAAELGTTTLDIRGRPQTIHVYGTRGGRTAVVAGGDGGWVHLGPQVAEYLASQGWYVLGFDTKAYLSAFTSKAATLRLEDVPGDMGVLVDAAAQGARGRPVLVGVSEGAGLFVAAASDATQKAKLAGVVALGLPDACELGWRWRDSLIYLTKGTPKEPTFSTAAIVGTVAPLPLVAIHSTRDEYVPVAEVERVMAKAGQPSVLWLVEAENHRFSGATRELEARLREALRFIDAHRP